MGKLGASIKQNGIEISDRYGDRESYFDLTPAGRTLVKTLDPLIDKYIRGKTLDAGAGRLTYTRRLGRHATRVLSLDRYRVRNGLSVQGDLDSLPFGSGSFDSIFCSQVLEHVSNPFEALAEFGRVIHPGGNLVLSVPHLAYLHNEPNDYYRYTEYGLRYLVEEAGFEVLEVRWSGGLLSFLGHLPSTLILNLTWKIPGVFRICFLLNRLWSRLIAGLESNDSSQKRFALNIAMVCRKRGRG